jgi:hypothetical protein
MSNSNIYNTAYDNLLQAWINIASYKEISDTNHLVDNFISIVLETSAAYNTTCLTTDGEWTKATLTYADYINLSNLLRRSEPDLMIRESPKRITRHPYIHQARAAINWTKDVSALFAKKVQLLEETLTWMHKHQKTLKNLKAYTEAKDSSSDED